MNLRQINWKVLIFSFVIVYLVAFIGSIFTSTSVDSAWYEDIKVPITPPNYVFPLVWNILFFLIALSLYFAWTSAGDVRAKRKIAFVFGINLSLNVLWSVLFFTLRNPYFAFIELVVFLLPSIFIMIFALHKIRMLSSILLIPYLLWVIFAGILNYLIISVS